MLAPLITFPSHDTDELYKQARQIRWDDFFDEDMTFAVFATVSDSRITHSKFAALRIKDGIVDSFLEHTGRRPNVSPINADVEINLHIRKDVAELSLDASGGALHRRGYREEAVSAPMQETVAAGIIRMSGWTGNVPLYDPMCGSGTLLCEALMYACRIPAGIFRKQFGFERFPDFDPAIWESVKQEADSRIREIPTGLIAGSDRAEEAVRATRMNMAGLHFGNRVDIQQADFRTLPGIRDGVIVTNPPYGIRMGKGEDMKALYRDLGDFLKQKCIGSTAYIYFGDPVLIKSIGLKPTWKKPLKLGGLDGRLVKYQLFEGERRHPEEEHPDPEAKRPEPEVKRKPSPWPSGPFKRK